jgi:hypothetical protein
MMALPCSFIHDKYNPNLFNKVVTPKQYGEHLKKTRKHKKKK